MAEHRTTDKPITDEIATTAKDIDVFAGWLRRLENPDPVLRTESSGQGLKLYDEVARDAHAGAVLQTRYLAVAGCEWEVLPASDRRADQAAAGLVREAFEGVGWSQMVQELMQAVLYGYYVIEVMWGRAGERWLPAAVMGKHPRRFSFDMDRRLRMLTPQNMIEGEALPDRKFVVFTWGDSDNPYGCGLGQRLWWPIWFKKHGIKYWLVFLEKFGMPTVLGKYPSGAPPEQQQRLLDAMDAIQHDTSIKIPDTMQVSLMEASRTGRVSYGDVVDYFDKQISRAVLGQTLTTGGEEGGSRALGEVHNDVRRDLVKADADMLCERLNATLVRWIVDLNLPGVTAYPAVWLRTEGEADLRPLAERDKILLGDLGLAARVPESYITDTYGIPLAQPGEAVIRPAESTPEKSQEKTAAAAFAAGAEVGQDLVDRLAEEGTAEGAGLAAPWLAAVEAWAGRARSIEAAADGVYDLYEAMDAAPLAAHLAEALARADRAGFDEAGGYAAAFAEGFWGPGKPFAEAAEFFRAKGLAIAGVAKADLVAAVKDELLENMQTGGTLADFRKALPDLFARHGVTPLHPRRIETIYRTNMQAAYQAGRHRQMTAPGARRARPFWRYVAVRDAATRPEHAAMHGKIFRHDHPVWQTWYPPNGFNCRCTVQTVSAREMAREGWREETEDPTGTLIEPEDPATGMTLPARTLLPDPGWGARPGTLEKILGDKQAAGELGRIGWRERPGQPGPVDLGRPTEGAIESKFWEPSPGKLDRLDTRMAARGIDRSTALEEIEAEYRRAMGISPNERFGVLRGPDGDVLKVGIDGLAHAMLKEGDGRERFIRYFRRVIESPYEVLLTEYETAAQKKTKLRKKYIGLFMEDQREGVVVVAETSPEGWLMWNVINARKGTLNRLRRGVKVLYGK